MTNNIFSGCIGIISQKLDTARAVSSIMSKSATGIDINCIFRVGWTRTPQEFDCFLTYNLNAEQLITQLRLGYKLLIPRRSPSHLPDSRGTLSNFLSLPLGRGDLSYLNRIGLYSTFQVCEIHSFCRDTAVPCPYGILNVLHKPGICCN